MKINIDNEEFYLIRINYKTGIYIKDLEEVKKNLDNNHPNSLKFIDTELNNFYYIGMELYKKYDVITPVMFDLPIKDFTIKVRWYSLND